MKIPKVIAHRGGRKWAPENTISAFRLSQKLGVDGIELDVQRCASGELVVFHDEDLSRTTNGAGLIKDCTYDELKRLSAGLWFNSSFEDEKVPLLSEVLNLLDGKTELNIELKNTPIEYEGIIDDLLDLIIDYPNPESLIISSFDHKLMKRFHAQAPKFKVALLAACVFCDLSKTANEIGAKYYHPAYDCFRADVADEARAAGLKMNVWTCNSQREWLDCLRMQVDGIITDDPEGLKNFLSRHATAATSV